MLSQLPFFVSFLFIATTILTLFLFYRSISKSSWGIGSRPLAVLATMIGWLILQGVLAYNGFYRETAGMPPNLLFAFIPPLAIIVFMFLRYRGKLFIISLSMKELTYLHIVRIPVEIVLYLLYLYKTVPELMTFEGRNFDIIAGISAPVIAYFGLTRKKVRYDLVLIWNLVALALLVNIVLIAILSAPFPFQQFAFDQPNVAILSFPFIWLPAFIVPVVLFSQLVCIWQSVRLSKRSGRADSAKVARSAWRH